METLTPILLQPKPLMQPKPRSERIDPQITCLPQLGWPRQLARRILRTVIRLLVWLFIDLTVHGRENLHLDKPTLVVANHLGDADLLIGVAVAPRFLEVVAKSELRQLPIVGWLMNRYGVIWVHRGRPDRRALRAVLQSLEQGRPVIIAPEGRESITGGLEEGTRGAAFLAMKSAAPILPVTLTGTENWRVYGNLKRLRRTVVILTIGEPFVLPAAGVQGTNLDDSTRRIMQALARLLPVEYRGVYQNDDEESRLNR